MLTQIHSMSVVAGGCVQAVPGRPAPHLRPYVVGYSGFEATPEGAWRRRMLPLGATTLIIDWTGVAPIATGARATGLLYDGDGWRHGVTVGVTPAGARLLLGVPQGELVDRIVPLDALGRPAWPTERLAEAPDWPARFAVLDRWVTSLLGATGRYAPEPVIERAWWRLQQGGVATIGALAAELGVGRRYLQLGFRRHVGLPPKTVARIARFQHGAAAVVRQGGSARHVPGYADQAHFCRETRAMVGLTPRELFASVQDARPTRT